MNTPKPEQSMAVKEEGPSPTPKAMRQGFAVPLARVKGNTILNKVSLLEIRSDCLSVRRTCLT